MTIQVTVGVPAYNGAATLRRAVESILGQTHQDCRVHISDDGSTDGTGAVGQALAAAHAAVSYTRQPTNLGPSPNFRFLLRQATTPYFMWLAQDDTLEPTYVERMLAALESDPGLVSCVSRVRFVRPDGSTRLASGTYPLQADTTTNLAAYLSGPDDNARQYGLHRTGALQKAFPTSDFLIGYDWALMAGTLLHGRHAEIPDVLMVREETPLRDYMIMIRRHARGWLERVLPMLPMSRDLIFRQKIPLRPPVLKALLHVNLSAHFLYVGSFHPRYAGVGRFLHRHLLWRLQTRSARGEP
ncbi:MAG: glycosyltransferase family 2 protein [Rhodopila sp.]|nr:glycosyltransferase family 2 protein [Rhodopila sp.]